MRAPTRAPTTTPTTEASGEPDSPFDSLSPALIEVLADAQRIGAIGPAPLEQHLSHALGFAAALHDLLPSAPDIIDLGSGGGIPGLVLAEVLPDARLTLLEGRTVRAERLTDVVAQLGWSARVDVVSARAEEAGRFPALRFNFDVAVARGFSAPGVTAECGAPFLSAGGLLCVSEPPGNDAFVRWPSEACAELGLVHVRALDEPFAFVVLRRDGECPERFPRRVGVPSKRPLF